MAEILINLLTIVKKQIIEVLTEKPCLFCLAKNLAIPVVMPLVLTTN